MCGPPCFSSIVAESTYRRLGTGSRHGLASRCAVVRARCMFPCPRRCGRFRSRSASLRRMGSPGLDGSKSNRGPSAASRCSSSVESGPTGPGPTQTGGRVLCRRQGRARSGRCCRTAQGSPGRLRRDRRSGRCRGQCLSWRRGSPDVEVVAVVGWRAVTDWVRGCCTRLGQGAWVPSGVTERRLSGGVGAPLPVVMRWRLLVAMSNTFG